MLTLWEISDAVPAVWILAFSRQKSSPLIRLLAWGTYQHVRAYAFVPKLNTWLFYDVTRSNTLVMALPDGKLAERYIGDFTRDCDLMSFHARPRAGFRYSPFTCVSAIKQLIGLSSSALRPDAMYRDCLAAGGILLARRSTAAPCLPGATA